MLCQIYSYIPQGSVAGAYLWGFLGFWKPQYGFEQVDRHPGIYRTTEHRYMQIKWVYIQARSQQELIMLTLGVSMQQGMHKIEREQLASLNTLIEHSQFKTGYHLHLQTLQTVENYSRHKVICGCFSNFQFISVAFCHFAKLFLTFPIIVLQGPKALIAIC